jgi:formylglycine-generating enzyme required for sulfatase activity
VCVSWNDATAYAAWLSRKTHGAYRLLSEAEYEYAARGGTTTSYWWGDDVGEGMANCLHCGSQWDDRQTAPVGSFPRNPFGLYDGAGNVGSWTQDCYSPSYDGAPTNGSARTDGDCSLRVLHGGSWSVTPQYMRSADHGRHPTGYRSFDVGFRMARSL